ncbi:hypothetical protein E2C01_049013 [Portunus trituberculatus]|uniref:Uncharacterized protein n=1 Tax=Portunus trituberculatus TaxID=210409 RepID=A0A5B7G4J1_PORTR|nr:hypothetical protein [Portunus trituberculatus]
MEEEEEEKEEEEDGLVLLPGTAVHLSRNSSVNGRPNVIFAEPPHFSHCAALLLLTSASHFSPILRSFIK